MRLYGKLFIQIKADIYETSLMRRLAGLLYIDSKAMGDIKEQIKKKLNNDILLMKIVSKQING